MEKLSSPELKHVFRQTPVIGKAKAAQKYTET